MQWQVHSGDLLDVPADVLICSANVYLTLSGGVGGALLLRYGPAMQEALARHLTERGVRYVERGAVIAVDGCGTPYRTVLHAVAVDGLYETNMEVVSHIIANSLQMAAQQSARTVALAALATGYGRKSMEFFASALMPIIDRDVSPIQTVVIGVNSTSHAEELLARVPLLTAWEA